ncbi:hypothetical protein ONZ45_g6037 [Pleurotus djamor]|nr:hypothetical protein ONZ45_g6037 [Pleurotus djamor]
MMQRIQNAVRITHFTLSRKAPMRPYHIKQAEDPHAQAINAGKEARRTENMHPLDAASPNPQYKPYIKGSGNQEQIGFVDQVGGQSCSADYFEFGKRGELLEGVSKGGVAEPINPALLGKALASSTKDGQSTTNTATAILTASQKTPDRTINQTFVAGTQKVPGANEDANFFASGVWSQGGVPGTDNSKLYSSVSKEDPYDPPRVSRDEKLRYGGREWKVNNKSEDV